VALRDRFPPPPSLARPLPYTVCKSVPQRVWPAAYVATACRPSVCSCSSCPDRLQSVGRFVATRQKTKPDRTPCACFKA
jgi:glycyl-tRNA synthetase alpha subunit